MGKESETCLYALCPILKLIQSVDAIEHGYYNNFNWSRLNITKWVDFGSASTVSLICKVRDLARNEQLNRNLACKVESGLKDLQVTFNGIRISLVA